MSEEFSYRNFLLQERKMLKVKDIEKSINWLYERIGKEKPEIKIFKSSAKFRKFLRTQTYFNDNFIHRYYSANNDNLIYGIRHEMKYFVYCRKRLAVGESIPDNDKKYIDFLSKGIWEFLPTELKNREEGKTRNVAVILPLPKKLRINVNSDYHSLEKPAIEWYDGKGKYYIHGVRFSKQLFKKVANRQLPAMKVLEIPNIEQRAMTLRLYGAEKLFAELNPELLDTFEREVMGKPNRIELYRINIGDRQTTFDEEGELVDNADYIHITKYNCPSTDKLYTSFVPNTIYLACSAMAWKDSLRTIGYVKHLKIEA